MSIPINRPDHPEFGRTSQDRKKRTDVNSVGPRFRGDFIVISEFSELVGPNPLIVLPDRETVGRFDLNAFVLRIMAVDYQHVGSKPGTGYTRVPEDTQGVISDSQEHCHAYVHHITLYDVYARGYVRPLCLAFVTADPQKIPDHFPLILDAFNAVSKTLKAGNHRLFLQDVIRREEYLLHSGVLKEMKEGTDDKESGSVETDEHWAGNLLMDKIGEASLSKSPMKGHVDEGELLLRRYGITPATIKQFLQDLRGFHQRVEDAGMAVPLTMEKKEEGHQWWLQAAEAFRAHPSGVVHWQPSWAEDAVHVSEQTLRPIVELSPGFYEPAVMLLKVIHRHFSRPALVLTMDSCESMLSYPQGSTLCIGGVAVLNFNLVSEGLLMEAACMDMMPRPVGKPFDGFDIPIPAWLKEKALGTDDSTITLSAHLSESRRTRVGTGLFRLRRRFPKLLQHMVFALLKGRPLIIRAKRPNRKPVDAMIRTLSLFVPGTLERCVESWRTEPLSLTDLRTVKLVGMPKSVHLPKCVHNYVSVLDYEADALRSPPFVKGLFVPKLLAQSGQANELPDENCLLSHVHAVLLNIAIKSRQHYHLHCLPSRERLLSPSLSTLSMDSTFSETQEEEGLVTQISQEGLELPIPQSPPMRPSTKSSSMLRRIVSGVGSVVRGGMPTHVHEAIPSRRFGGVITRRKLLERIGVTDQDADIVEYWCEVVRSQQVETLEEEEDVPTIIRLDHGQCENLSESG